MVRTLSFATTTILLLVLLIAAICLPTAKAFAPLLPSTISSKTITANLRLLQELGRGRAASSSLSQLHLASASGNKKRRRRRRKTVEDAVIKPVPATTEEQDIDEDDDDDDEDATELMTEKEQVMLDDDTVSTTGFEFTPPKADPAISSVDAIVPPPPATDATDGPIPLPDIRDQLKRKELQEKIAQMEAEEESRKVKIKRSDKEAFTKLLEAQPFADADDSFFEEEAYGTVSALLGERAKPFLGIPTGPLQVGHFIGALGIILMAFVDYPGFPLTNLPTPIRDALAGGLGTVYVINTVLAVLAVFKAQERGQPIPLWVAKTFSVGGLAYDQLTQLPTTEEVERAQSIKGARALKNRKKG